MANYQDLFEAALARTQANGLRAPAVQVRNDRLLSSEFHARFPYAIRDAFGDIGAEELMAQCLSIHFRLGPEIARLVNAQAYLTLGWLRADSGANLFEFNDDWIAECLRRGHPGSSTAPIHAWLTLPTMEIIDLSIATTLATVNGLSEGVGGVIAMHADDVKGGLQYVPMLVGDEFLRRAGMLMTGIVIE